MENHGRELSYTLGKKTDVPASRTRSHTAMVTNPQSNGGVTEASVLAALVDRIEKITVSKPSICKFEGDVTAAEGWLRQYERYASLQSMMPRQQADALAFHISGIALTWYTSLVVYQAGLVSHTRRVPAKVPSVTAGTLAGGNSVTCTNANSNRDSQLLTLRLSC